MYGASYASPSIPSLEETLRKEICYPEFAKTAHEEGTVLVCFCIDSNGKIILKESNSDNEMLKNYVIGKLSSLKLQSAESTEKEYYLRFVFRLY